MNRTILYLLTLFILVILSCGGNVQKSAYTGVLEGKTIHLPALTGGKIIELFADEGEEVASGDTLAVIDTTELSLQLKQLEASLEELEVREEIAGTNLDRAKVDLDYIQKKEKRIEALYEKQATAQQNLDDLRNQLQKVESAHKAAGQEVRSLLARKKQLKSQIEITQKRITDATITSPVSGIIATRYYETGEAVLSMQPVFELVHIQKLEVKIYISEEKLPQVRYGQKVKIRIDGLKEEMEGSISWISPKAEFTPKNILTPETRTSLVYAVRIIVSNPERVLKHGMPVEVIL
ncbi:MAG: hypothetical protein AMJ90_02210 [candidate division Zixibacteria bacterium SM23_73_2]|nr:MAG: hypothetical protein AMJ90_02210 [candidate division Zixibacteria bacterium SM23_73_2]